MITTPKMLGIVAAAFLAGTFVASPELRAYAANTVFSTDIVDGQVMTADLANNAVTAAKIKDGEVKAAEIATDAVGAAEITGVTKLIFAQCRANNSVANTPVDSGKQLAVPCSIVGVDIDDSAVVTMNTGVVCFDIMKSEVNSSGVLIILENECGTTVSLSNAQFGIIVYDK